MTTHTSNTLESPRHLSFPVLLSIFVLLMLAFFIPALYAGGPTTANSESYSYICYIAANFEDNAGRELATIDLSVLGTLALLGRVTWTQTIVIGLGCSVLFGAPTLAITLGAAGICP